MQRLGMVDVIGRRVVAERHDFGALQCHDAERLGPAPVVADAHADDGVKGAPHLEALVADIEIALFEVLERCVRQVLGMPQATNLAVTAEDMAVGADQERGVVTPGFALFLGQLGIAQIKPDLQLARQIE